MSPSVIGGKTGIRDKFDELLNAIDIPLVDKVTYVVFWHP